MKMRGSCIIYNSLESRIRSGQSYHKSKPKPKTPVTIVIGLTCCDGILVGSDSRTTNPDFTIRDDAKKIRAIRLQGPDGEFPDCALIAQSGDDALGSRILDRIEALAKDTPLTDWQTVCEIGNKAIADEQKQLRIPFEGPGFSMAEFQKILQSFDSSFMIAHYFKAKPYIFTADFYPGRFSLRKSTCVSLGCGRPLAEFLLDGFDFSNLIVWGATAAMVYVIEQVKAFDPRCGGPTKIAWTCLLPGAELESRPGKPVFVTGKYDDSEIEKYLAEISPIRAGIKKEWNEKMEKIMFSVHSKHLPEITMTQERLEQLQNRNK